MSCTIIKHYRDSWWKHSTLGISDLYIDVITGRATVDEQLKAGFIVCPAYLIEDILASEAYRQYKIIKQFNKELNEVLRD